MLTARPLYRRAGSLWSGPIIGAIMVRVKL